MILQRSGTECPPPWADHLVGTAAVGPPLTPRPGPGEAPVAVASATFAPGARTHWHSHDGGQLLIVVAGQGWVGVRDGEPRRIDVGDTIWAPAGEEHWHGATDDTFLTHVAITWGATRWRDAAPSFA